MTVQFEPQSVDHSTDHANGAVCVIVPFFNHGPYIAEVVERLKPYHLPLIIINDGSDEEHRAALEPFRHSASTTTVGTLNGDEAGDSEYVNLSTGTRGERQIVVLDHEINLGKGAAVITGLREAKKRGFRYALQVDADCQHCIEDIPRFLAQVPTAVPASERYALTTNKLTTAVENQNSSDSQPLILEKQQGDIIVLGTPVFGADAPLERVWFRKISTALIWLQTLSCKVRDGMFGFRLYPIDRVLLLHARQPFEPRMGFDVEVIVRLLRDGVDTVSLPSKVRYHKNGISHYCYLRDNLGLVRVHCNLILRPITRILLGRKSGGSGVLTPLGDEAAPIQQASETSPSSEEAKKKEITTSAKQLTNRSSIENSEWYRKPERGSKKLLRFALSVARLVGPRVVKACLHPVVLFYLLVDRQARTASADYLERVYQDFPGAHSLRGRLKRLAFAYHHLMTFAHHIAAGVWAWANHGRAPVEASESLLALRNILGGDNPSGGIILSAHFGALEAARATYASIPDVDIVPVMYHGNSEGFRGFLAEVNPVAAENVILVDEFSPATIMSLQSRIAKGGYLALLADRIPPTDGASPDTQATISVNFLGSEIKLPAGPFLLAKLLRTKVSTLFCTTDSEGRVEVHFRELDPELDSHAPAQECRKGKRARRRSTASLQAIAQQYANALEEVCRAYPYCWFNFFPYFETTGE